MKRQKLLGGGESQTYREIDQGEEVERQSF